MAARVCPRCGESLLTGNLFCAHCGLPVPSSKVILTPASSLRGRYEIQQLIHTGGMSYVYLAKDKTLFERLCVVKEIKEQIRSPQHQAKLEEEALRMARLTHPSIAMILDHFVESGRYFLIEEYVRGKSLSDVSRERREPLREEEVVRWGLTICDVLVYIHSKGIIHRDISPDNIMLTEEGIIKFIDFGTLRELRYIASGGTAGIGKYGYTPPEQWKGQYTRQSDIFALGATIFQLLTGYLPVSESYLTGQGPQKEDFSPVFPPIRSKNSSVSQELESILQKALKLDLSERYDSVTEMRKDLSRLTIKSATSEETVSIADKTKPSSKNMETSKQHSSMSKKAELPNDNIIENVQRKAISDCIQHPSTLLPLAVCAVSVGYVSLLSPMFGGAIVAVAVSGISGVTAIITFVSRYPAQCGKIQKTRSAHLDEAQMRELRAKLEKGFFSIESPEGTKTLEELVSEHEQLESNEAQQTETDPLSLPIYVLADEMYRRGLSVLSDTLDLLTAIHTPGRTSLEKQIAELENEEAFLRGRLDSEERLALKQDALASLKERLNTLERLELYADRLMNQARRCGASLHSTRMELAARRAGTSKVGVDSVIAALKERIEQIRNIQNELNKSSGI